MDRSLECRRAFALGEERADAAMNAQEENVLMKTLKILLSVLVLLFLFAASGYAAEGSTRTVSGQVAAVDNQAIVVDVGSGKTLLDVGAIIQSDTELMVKGKSTPIGDLAEKVKVGDAVTLTYVMTDNLYAKEIVKN